MGVLRLYELPTDIWRCIVSAGLDSNDLVALRLTGSRALWQKVTSPGVARSLTFLTAFPTRRVPPRAILGMPNLESLEITITTPSNRTHELLEPITPTLQALSLFWSLEHYGRRWPSWNVSVLPPSLTTFKSNLPIYDADLASLPRTLTSLELVRQNAVDGHGFKFLPPKLLHLRLFVNSERLPTLKDNLRYLTTSLTSLELPYLAHIDAPFLSQLPGTLLQLNLSRVHQFTDKEIALLPRGLTHLNIKGTTSLTDRSIQELPPKLAFLCIQPNETLSQLTAGAVQHMPPTLTSYWELPRSLQQEYTRLYLRNQLPKEEYAPPPPLVQKKLPGWVASNLTDELMQLLPTDLESLDLTRNRVITEYGLLRVPMGLRKLRLPNLSDAPLRWPGSLVRYLPRGLTDLDLPFVDDLQDSHISALPTSLTRLRLCVEAKQSPVQLKAFKSLPTHLKHLEVPFCLLRDIDFNAALFMLPSTCQQITFGSGPGSVTLRRDSNNTFLRDTLKHRYFANKTVTWVFDELLRPIVSILGLALVTHLLFIHSRPLWIPPAIVITPTIASSLLFVVKRYVDPGTSLFTWRPSTDIMLPQLIIFCCYSIMYILYAYRRPWSPW